MKRFLAALLAVLMLLSLTACRAKVVPASSPAPEVNADMEAEGAKLDAAARKGAEEAAAPKPEAPSPAPEDEKAPAEKTEDSKQEEADKPEDEPFEEPDDTAPENVPDEDGYYYDVENVVLYLHYYGRLPGNYITKKEAEALGWSGGSVERYKKDAAIGGDRFGNYEGSLPKEKGRTYTECDIDTLGYKNRGSRRLIFSSDGLYFYTSDHYESFTELYVEDGMVIWD